MRRCYRAEAAEEKKAASRVQEAAEEDAAATKVQSVFRSKQARNEVQLRRKRKEAAEQDAAATKVQSVYRSKQARNEVQLRRRKKEAAEEDAAATKVQSVFRSKRARDEAVSRRKQRDTDDFLNKSAEKTDSPAKSSETKDSNVPRNKDELGHEDSEQHVEDPWTDGRQGAYDSEEGEAYLRVYGGGGASSDDLAQYGQESDEHIGFSGSDGEDRRMAERPEAPENLPDAEMFSDDDQGTQDDESPCHFLKDQLADSGAHMEDADGEEEEERNMLAEEQRSQARSALDDEDTSIRPEDEFREDDDDLQGDNNSSRPADPNEESVFDDEAMNGPEVAAYADLLRHVLAPHVDLPPEVWSFLAASFMDLSDRELEDPHAIAEFLEAFVLDAFHEQGAWPASEDAERLLALGKEVSQTLQQFSRALAEYQDEDESPWGPQEESQSNDMAYANLAYSYEADGGDGVDFSGGYVQLCVVKAEDLRCPDPYQAADPYVKVTVGGVEVFRSEAAKNTSSPQWDASCQFAVGPDEATIVLSIVDKELGNKGGMMGQAIVELFDVPEDESVEQWVEVEPEPGCMNAKGRILVRVSLQPMSIT